MNRLALASILVAAAGVTASAQVNLANYSRVGRHSLPAGLTQAREASGVTWNRDTNSLFIVGDGGRGVAQVSLTGQLINSMTLATGSSSQGTAFFDPEGIAYLGNGQFAMVEERTSIISRFTYTAGTTLDRPGAQSVKFAPNAGNSGYEGMSFDPTTGGFVFVKEVASRGIFTTQIDFAAGTSSNGNATTVPTNLFDPGFAGLTDFAEVFSVANSNAFTGSTRNNLLILSQEDGRVVEVNRAGTVISELLITGDPSDTLSMADMQHEGMTMDDRGYLYIVNENGGGGIDFPELWVYAPVPAPASLGLMGLSALGAFARRRRA
jgi:uncharacterized protein YjiK